MREGAGTDQIMVTPGAVVERIADYLANGGLFNPEMMDHGAVRDLLIDCREALLRHIPDPSQELIEAVANAISTAPTASFCCDDDETPTRWEFIYWQDSKPVVLASYATFDEAKEKRPYWDSVLKARAALSAIREDKA